MKPIEIAEGIYLMADVDWNIRDFHGYSTDRGTSYNAYLVVDEKTVLIDTAKKGFEDDLIDGINYSSLSRNLGITKYKARRKETQRKLDRTQADLTRLYDIIDEIGRDYAAFDGMSIFEISHRSKAFARIIDEADSGVRTITRLGLPNDVLLALLTYFFIGLVLLSRGRLQLMRVRWLVDRVDRAGRGAGSAPSFAVWDYKTGGARAYRDRGDPFRQGRLVQSALYVALVRERLRALHGRVDQAVDVSEAGPGDAEADGHVPELVSLRRDGGRREGRAEGHLLPLHRLPERRERGAAGRRPGRRASRP